MTNDKKSDIINVIIEQRCVMKQDRSILKKIKITDNIMFTSVFMNIEIIKKFLQDILNLTVNEIVFKQKEKVIDDIGDARGVRLDVYAIDDNNNIYDIEIQLRNDKDDLPERFRYYQGMIDKEVLIKGDNFKALKTTYIIFICMFNPFKDLDADDVIYHIKSQFITSKNKIYDFDDRSYKIIINTTGNLNLQNDDIKSFVQLLKDGYKSEMKSNLSSMIENEMTKLINDRKWSDNYMTVMQEYAQEYAKEYAQEKVKEAKLEQKVEIAKNLLFDCVDLDIVAKCTGLSKSQLEQIKKEL